jgi:potassium-transporting ATPase KdpC subunit
MRRQLLPALLMMFVMTVLLGLVYPLVVVGIGQGLVNEKADGSLVSRDGDAVGSELIGQSFTDEDGNALPEYFQSRPSAATGASGEAAGGYDPTLSLGSNLGPTNPCFVPVEDEPCLGNRGQEKVPVVVERVHAYRELNGLDDDTPIPVDAVTASGSGLDPDISVANARLQALRVAEERGLDLDVVLDLVDEHTSDPQLGFLGEQRVNVLQLNLALDDLSRS